MKLNATLLALPLLVLTACGDSEPSQKDIKKAYDSFLTQMVGGMNSGVFTVGDINCAQIDDITYKCSFRYMLHSNEEGQKVGLFTKSGDGWSYKPAR